MRVYLEPCTRTDHSLAFDSPSASSWISTIPCLEEGWIYHARVPPRHTKDGKSTYDGRAMIDLSPERPLAATKQVHHPPHPPSPSPTPPHPQQPPQPHPTRQTQTPQQPCDRPPTSACDQPESPAPPAAYNAPPHRPRPSPPPTRPNRRRPRPISRRGPYAGPPERCRRDG